MKEVSREDIYQLLQDIQDRPGAYLGKKSLKRLRDLLGGFFHALYVAKNSIDQESIFSGFQEWIEVKYDISAHWSSIILFGSLDNDEVAFDRFFQLFHEYNILRNDEDAYQKYLEKSKKLKQAREEYESKRFDIEWGDMNVLPGTDEASL